MGDIVMKFSSSIAIASAGLALCLAATPAFAAELDLFLQIDGIQGASTAKGQAASIVIDSYDLGVSSAAAHAASGGGHGAGKATFNPLKVKLKADKSLPLLFKAVASGQHFKRVVL